MDKMEWQTDAGQTWAQEWRRTDRSFGLLTERLLASLRGMPLTQVLDIGCGAGELSLAIARGHPADKVVGVDISPQLVKTASERGSHLQNASFVRADASTWQPDADFAPSLLMSRHGVMFFDDPVAAFTNLAQLAAPNARLVFSCFRSPQENPFLTEIARLLPNPPAPSDPHAPGPMAFADPDRVRSILSAAGWGDITFEPVDFPMVTGAGEDPVEDATEYFSRIGPAARAIGEMDEDVRAAFLDRVRNLAKNNCREGIVSLPAAAWIVSARKV